MSQIMLTTLDNPFNPFTHWKEWWAFDHWHGYNCSELLGRIASTSHDLSDEENEETIDEAIREIVREDVTNTYTIAFEDEASRVKELEEMEKNSLMDNDEWDFSDLLETTNKA